MRECKKCHGKYDDKIKKCPACDLILGEEPPIQAYIASKGIFKEKEYPLRDERIAELSVEISDEVKPKSLGGLSFLSSFFKVMAAISLAIEAFLLLIRFFTSNYNYSIYIHISILICAVSLFFTAILVDALADIIKLLNGIYRK